MEVIDLTGDSPKADAAEQSHRAQKKAERKKERRARKDREREERRGESKHDRERDSRSRHDDDDDERDRKRRRSRSRDPDRKRHKKDRERDRERDEDPPIPDNQLFFFDKAPAALPPAARFTAASANKYPNGLILPAHVSVFGDTATDIVPAAAPDSDSDDDYIEYLDYDNKKDFVRYYDKTEEKRTKIVCKRCGAEDEHSTFECRVLICLTCGARDDHSTERCDVDKTCYKCGMKGHINSNCPNHSARLSRDFSGCERCGSSHHLTSECPTLWRVYIYVEAGDQERILKTRKEKKDLRLGQGGEGYIADDEWCYNCGGAGHWGDDCREFYHPEPIVEPTAFSYHILSNGPFPLPETASGNRAQREWEREIALPGGVEKVGKRGKKKEMEKLARRAEQEEAEDDWFQNRGSNQRDRQLGQLRLSGNIPTGPRSMRPPANVPDRPFQFGTSSSKLMLAERLSDPVPDRPQRDRRDTDSRDRRRNDRERDRDRLMLTERLSDPVPDRPQRDRRDTDSRDRRHDRERDRDRHRGDERGPRYKGGYSR
ncbi:hypothetical protein DFH07DRAFT_1063351 [Mycena maculata]|uniref:CCHC-type domain-containing protein n=1 Tax=Mycena maculata TaxID=230809 RepID=A0AAD7N3U9_9AGAR|nr:hypothetical protein DFH07DRAFT_1063351 [Mycena maculata]